MFCWTVSPTLRIRATLERERLCVICRILAIHYIYDIPDALLRDNLGSRDQQQHHHHYDHRYHTYSACPLSPFPSHDSASNVCGAVCAAL